MKLKDIIKDLKLGKIYTDKDRPPFKVNESANPIKVKKAVDDFVKNNNLKIEFIEDRFAKIIT